MHQNMTTMTSPLWPPMYPPCPPMKLQAAQHITQSIVLSWTPVPPKFLSWKVPVVNKHPTSMPLKVALADGHHIMSTHMCDIAIDGLPQVLTGHIIPDLSIASLFGIRVLTEAGCNVKFTKGECIIRYDGNIILRGTKDPATDLWTLPLGSPSHTSHECAHKADTAATIMATSPQDQVVAFAHTMT